MNSVFKSTPSAARLRLASGLLDDFAERTGLSGERPPHRYLWTDAFAVCTWLGLYRLSGIERYRELAEQLITQVHGVLGRHRPDDVRRGWLSGLGDAAGWQHPTRGGLRIGKPLPERPAGEPLNESVEWDRDGQYFHYLTKWMHALQMAGRVCDDPRYTQWAIELALRTVPACLIPSEHPPTALGSASVAAFQGVAWKMSIGLDRPQVAAVGQHDALDGLQICTALAQDATNAEQTSGLQQAIRMLDSLCHVRSWATPDPLGAGGLLVAAIRAAEANPFAATGGISRRTQLWADALYSVQHVAARIAKNEPSEYRLAFREFGLSLGLAGLDFLPEQWEPTVAETALRRAFEPYRPLRVTIEEFWSDPQNQRASGWTDHRDINSVMLAASLVPHGFYGDSAVALGATLDTTAD